MSDHHPVGVTLENRLMGQGIYVTSFEQTQATIELEYETVLETPQVTSHEVGLIVRTLLAIADERDDWTHRRLEATARDTDGSFRGTWFVERGWFEDLHDTLSEVEFSQHVLRTISADTDKI